MFYFDYYKGSERQVYLWYQSVSKQRYSIQKSWESCLQYAAQCTLLLLSSLNILKHRNHFISKYDTLICKWICPHTYIHHNHSRWKSPFAMRVSTEDSKMDGRCSVKASARYACRLWCCTTLHLMQQTCISCVIYRRWFLKSSNHLSNYYRLAIPLEGDSIRNCISKIYEK